MTTKSINYGLLIILATGLPLVLSLLFLDEVGLFRFLLLAGFFGFIFLVSLVIVIDRANWKAAKTGGVLFGLLVGVSLANTEYFKSPTILEAWLKDDLSGLHLYLRENGKFELVAVSLFSEETFKGKYKLEGNQIIFLDRPYNNDFIPNTLTIWQDKVVIGYNGVGEPDLGFAHYFQIQKNRINNAP
jgi:hypothetical protein